MPYGVSKHKPYYGVGTYSGFGEVFDVNKNQWYQSPSVFSDTMDIITNWTAAASTTLSSVNGELKILSTAAVQAAASSTFASVIGKRYRAVGKKTSSTGTISFKIGTTLQGVELYYLANSSAVEITADFTASTTLTYLSLQNYDIASGTISTWDNIAIYPINDDGSVDLSSATPITASRSYLNAKVMADAGGQPTLVEQLPKIEYKKDLEVDTLKVHGGFDLNQKWQNVSKVFGATYTNTTGKPIIVSIIGTCNTAGNYVALLVDGIFAGSAGIQVLNNYVGVIAIVPNGSTYKLTISGGTFALNVWSELR